MAGLSSRDSVSACLGGRTVASDAAGFYHMFQMGEDRPGRRAVHFLWQVFVQTLHDLGDGMKAAIQTSQDLAFAHAAVAGIGTGEGNGVGYFRAMRRPEHGLLSLRDLAKWLKPIYSDNACGCTYLDHRLAEVDLGMARRMMQRHESLARQLPPGPDIVPHDDVAAGKPVLVP